MRVVDTEYNITRVNQAFLDLVGLAKDDCVGQKCYDIFAGPVCHTADCTIRKVIEEDKRVEYEITKQCPDGKTVPCIVVAAPFKKSDGKIIGIVEDYRDITRHKMVEEEMRYQATHCIGIAIYPDDGEDVIELMKHADRAMYRAKETGNEFEFYGLENTDILPTVSGMN